MSRSSDFGTIRHEKTRAHARVFFHFVIFLRASSLLAIIGLGSLLNAATVLQAPKNLRLVGLSADSFSVAAEVPSPAVACAFRTARLETVPETVVREDFANVPYLADSAWTVSCDNANPEASENSPNYDSKTATDIKALRIVPSEKEDSRLEIASPVFGLAVTECSFFCKLTAKKDGCSDLISIEGRSDSAAQWIRFASFAPVATMSWVTNRIDAAVGIKQVRWVFTSEGGSSRNCILDTLRVVTGGYETPVAESEATETVPVSEGEARLTRTGLQMGRYFYSAKAVGGEGVGDSDWTAGQLVDLAWAEDVVTSPTDISAKVINRQASVSWAAVDGADHYLVTVMTVGDSPETVIRDRVATGTAIVLEDLPLSVDYMVSVTAVSPSGLSRATSEPVALLQPRRVQPVSLSAMKRTKSFFDDFAALVGLKESAEVASLALPFWQFRVSGSEPSRLTYTDTCGTSALGVFIVSDAARAESSYMLATHATGTGEAMIGLAFTNDLPVTVAGLALAFDSVQLSFQNAKAKTQVLECLVTDGETAIDAEGDWRSFPIAVSAPVTKDSPPEERVWHRTAQGPVALGGVKVRPGQALVVRWCDEEMASSPMIGIDNVRLTFRPSCFRLSIR